jgi:Concanavalin A-like lectin/glucanases superfamily
MDLVKPNGRARLKAGGGRVNSAWILNESAGRVQDSRSKHLSTLNAGCEWKTTRDGLAVGFTAGSGSVVLGDFLNFERTDSFSIHLRLKANATSYATDAGVMSRFDGSGIGISLRLAGASTGDPFQLTLRAGSGNALIVNIARPSNTDIVDLILTYSGNSAPSGIIGYVDGATQTQTTVANTLTSTIITTANATLGAETGGTSAVNMLHLFAQVWDYALSPVEVQKYYRKPYSDLEFDEYEQWVTPIVVAATNPTNFYKTLMAG